MGSEPKELEEKPRSARLARAARPFSYPDAAHAVVKAAEQIGWDFGEPEKFLKRVQHVEYGLSAEMEFAAILRWLGLCAFVHRLNEDLLEDSERSLWNVPDLFAVFTSGGSTFSALIEVKTGDELKLQFKKRYLDRLRNYAALLQKPLLIAWRPLRLGFWILFDPTVARDVDDETVEVDFEAAIRNDLMSVLAGDYYIVPKKGAGLRIEAKRIGEKQPTEDGYSAVFRTSDAYLHDAEGARDAGVPDTITWAILSTLEGKQDVDEDGFIQSFVASGGMSRAQMVLRTAVGFSLRDEDRIHWREVGRHLEQVVSCEALLNDAQSRFGTFVSYIFHQQPQNMPSVIPATWEGLTANGVAAKSRTSGTTAEPSASER